MIILSEKENLRKIRWALAAMGRDPGRPPINQLLIGPFIVATDGHRLHYVNAPELENAEPHCLRPEVAMALPTLARCAEQGDSLFFEKGVLSGGSWRLATARGATLSYDPPAFPPFLQSVRDPKTDAAAVTVKVIEFRKAVAEMPKDSVVVLIPQGLALTVRARAANELDSDGWPLWRQLHLDTVDPSPLGTPLTVGVNRSYLLDAVRGLTANATLHFGKTSLDQLRVTHTNDAGDVYTAAIMPVRLTDKDLGL